MAYSSSGDIEAIDYNNLAWGSDVGGTYTSSSAHKNIAVVWGVGDGELGYGQSTSSIPSAGTGPTGSLTAVDGPSAGSVTADDVTAAQWNGLILTLNKALYHQNSANLTSLSGVTVGSDITYYSQISTGVTTAWNNASTADVRAVSDGAATTGTVASTWQNYALFVFVVTFSSADAVRYFFNAGGKIKLTTAGPTSQPAGSRSKDWGDLCTACGTIAIGHRDTTKSGGSGTPTTLLNANDGGYWNLTGLDTTHFKQSSTTATYTANYVRVNASVSGATGSSGGLGNVLTITVLHQDDDSNTFQQTVNTGSTASLVVSSPNSGVLTNTWGTPTVSVTVTQS